MPFEIHDQELRLFGEQLKTVPREVQTVLRRQIRSAASTLMGDIRSRASWSSRIPGAVKTKVSFGGGSGGGVTVYVDSRQAPHARPLEFGGRHPTWGDAPYVAFSPRPFFLPSTRAAEPQLVRDIQAAIDSALGRIT